MIGRGHADTARAARVPVSAARLAPARTGHADERHGGAAPVTAAVLAEVAAVPADAEVTHERAAPVAEAAGMAERAAFDTTVHRVTEEVGSGTRVPGPALAIC